MKAESFRILSPCGILGYGFPDASFDRGLSENPDAIIVDAGSTDAGPHKLGANVAIVSRRAYKKDLSRLIHAGFAHKIPVIVGSAGGSGAKAHVDWTLSILDEILEDLNNSESHLRVKIAVISADIPKKLVREKLAEGKITPMSRTVPILTKEAIAETTGIVAQMGHEPILEALENGADIVICGRAYDPAPFAAAAIRAGFDPGLAYHMGKILECGALCADPGTAKDCILGEIKQDCFEVHSLNPELRSCSAVSMRAWTSAGQSGSATAAQRPVRMTARKSISSASGSAVLVSSTLLPRGQPVRAAPRSSTAVRSWPKSSCRAWLPWASWMMADRSGCSWAQRSSGPWTRSAGSADRIGFNGAWRGSRCPGRASRAALARRCGR